jgi:hypothetical protein
MIRKDLIGSVVLLGIAAAYYVASTDIQDSALADEVGPRGLPTVLSIFLAGIAVVIGVRALLAAPASLAAAKPGKDAEAKWLRAFGLLGLAGLYIPFANYLGYWPALFLLLIAIPLYEGMKPSWRLLAVAAGGATFFWVLFEMALGVRQPSGVLF